MTAADRRRQLLAWLFTIGCLIAAVVLALLVR